MKTIKPVRPQGPPFSQTPEEPWWLSVACVLALFSLLTLSLILL